MRRPRRPGALRIALVAPLMLAGLARDAAATGEKLPWGEWAGESRKAVAEDNLSLAVSL